MGTPLNLAVYEEQLELARRRVKSGTIRSGDKGAAVRALQQRLTELGIATDTDGVFGTETEQSLRDFQKRSGAKVDGILGPETLKHLLAGHKPQNTNAADTSLDAITRVVAPGMSQASSSGTGLGRAKALQRGGGSRASRRTGKNKKLAPGQVRAGKGVTRIDPVTGAPVATASTGPIGSTKPQQPTRMTGESPEAGREANQTAKAIGAGTQHEDSNPAFNQLHPRGTGGQFAQKGSSGPEVSNLQTALNQTHSTNLQVDGQFGPKTDAALRGYQKHVGLKVDGIAGPKTAASLRRRLKIGVQFQTPTAA